MYLSTQAAVPVLRLNNATPLVANVNNVLVLAYAANRGQYYLYKLIERL